MEERVLKIAPIFPPKSHTLLTTEACDVETIKKEHSALAVTNSSITDSYPKNIIFMGVPAFLNCDIRVKPARPTTDVFSNADFIFSVGLSELNFPGIIRDCKNLFFVFHFAVNLFEVNMLTSERDFKFISRLKIHLLSVSSTNQ